MLRSFPRNPHSGMRQWGEGGSSRAVGVQLCVQLCVPLTPCAVPCAAPWAAPAAHTAGCRGLCSILSCPAATLHRQLPCLRLLKQSSGLFGCCSFLCLPRGSTAQTACWASVGSSHINTDKGFITTVKGFTFHWWLYWGECDNSSQ